MKSDLILTGGSIIDGTGSAQREGDVRISGEKIAWTGDGPRDGAERLDISGKIVCPGFVDFHAHTDMTLLVNPACESKITQGVTLEVNGNCGVSDAPVVHPEARERAKAAWSKLGVELNWESMGEMLDVLQQHGSSINFCTLLGHGNVRRQVVGEEDRPATPEEVSAMQGVVARAMDEGAVGLSTGLIYPPSCYGSTDEIAALCEPVARRGGIYATHMRSEADELIASVREAIQIGEISGAKVQISHLKACGKSNHGDTLQALELIEQARARGVDVTADQYPYIATCTGLDTAIPAWAHSGGPRAMRERLSDPSTRSGIEAEIRRDFEPGGYQHDAGGMESIVISSVSTDANRWCEGRNMAEIAKARGEEPVQALINFLLEEDFHIGMVHFCLSETDVKAVMQTPYTLFGSDATARACSGPMGTGKPHPRAFGTFPRILRRYVREQKVIGLEMAIQKMTSLAADRLGLSDRGRLQEGCQADIVVFDPESVRDTATFVEPQQLSAGIEHVMVNGDFAVKDGKLTGAKCGSVVRHGGN